MLLPDKQHKLDTAEDLLKDLTSSKDHIKAIAPKRKKRVTKLWKDFENGYLKDLEVCKSVNSTTSCNYPFNTLDIQTAGAGKSESQRINEKFYRSVQEQDII